MKLKPLLFLAGVAGAVIAARKRGATPPIPPAVSDAASRVSDAVPQPVREAAQSAGETVQRAVQSVAPGDGGDDQPQQRYEPPAEGLAQEPATTGGPPSDTPPVTPSDQPASDPSPGLNTPDHEPPEGAVMPDVSADDPLVREAENAAAADAGSIGGNVDRMAAQDESFPTDPAVRPVVEGAGDENEETFETREGIERGHRETET
jgi:hypothetical protein